MPTETSTPLDFAARQRAATRALAEDYATGRGPVVVGGLESLDRALASLDAATPRPAPVAKSEPAPASPSEPDTDPLADFDRQLAFYGFNATELREANPVAYLALGQAYSIDLARAQAMVISLARLASELRPYQAAPGARNALRHSLHQTGVISNSTPAARVSPRKIAWHAEVAEANARLRADYERDTTDRLASGQAPAPPPCYKVIR